MRIDILSLFPEMFAPLDASMLRRAREKELIQIHTVNIRDFAFDKHQITDDRLYGGGAGMVMKPEPITAAVEAVRAVPRPRIIVTAPSGRPYTQAIAEELAKEEQLILICGHYEGIDQRVIDSLATDVLSLGDFVLTGGEIPALAIVDSVARLIPGVLGDERAAEEESFSDGLLEYPQYTRPLDFRGMQVPAVLQSGDHAKIAAWRRQKALELTLGNRPDLLSVAPLSPEDNAYLGQLRAQEKKPFSLYAALLHYPVYNKKNQVINTSLTNLDLHDIARAAATYALNGYYLIQPLKNQRELMQSLLDHWHDGFGATYNPDREQALSLVSILPSLQEAAKDIREKCGETPKLIVTSAKLETDITAYPEMREILHKEGGCYLLAFGTGWGLADEIVTSADYRMQPIYGREGYNHLSVRSAAAIIFDRLLGE